MISGTTAGDGKRRIRLGMVGGGPGAIYRRGGIASLREWTIITKLVAAALSSDAARSRAAAQDLHIAPDRAYGSYTEMARAEATRPARIEAVAIVTPIICTTHGKSFRRGGISRHLRQAANHHASGSARSSHNRKTLKT